MSGVAALPGGRDRPCWSEARVVAGPALADEQVVALAFLPSALQLAGAADRGAEPNGGGVRG
ncbi:MAG: hypothetical protein ACRDTH_01885 [Pseudonocardiaceae bacterium]